MRPAARLPALLAALLIAAAGGQAQAADDLRSAVTPLMYGLVGDPATEHTLQSARWGFTPVSLRLDTAAGFGAHEVRILSAGSVPNASPLDPFGTLDNVPGMHVDPLRATYRYTLLAEPTWSMKFGLSANLGDGPAAWRLPLHADKTGFGSLPLLHMAGVAQWSPRWRVGFAVDGLATPRGRAVDLGVHVDYLWTDSMSVYGGYQMTDAAGEAETYYGSTLTNRANIGLRYRF